MDANYTKPKLLEAPVSLTGLFGADSDVEDEEENGFKNEKSITKIKLGGIDILVSQMAWHQANANQVWPGAFTLADHLIDTLDVVSDSEKSVSVESQKRYEGALMLELGSATGALTVALLKTGRFRLVTR